MFMLLAAILAFVRASADDSSPPVPPPVPRSPSYDDLAYAPVGHPSLTLNYDYLSSLRRGLEKAGVYRAADAVPAPPRRQPTGGRRPPLQLQPDATGDSATWTTKKDVGTYCSGSEYKGDLGPKASDDACLTAAKADGGINYAVWRGDGDGHCYTCDLSDRGDPSKWKLDGQPGAVSFVADHVTPPLPPPPPSGPAPCSKFTLASGLIVGLRCGSGAIQFLGHIHDGNFSYVPPLMNVYPQREHRDQPGAHHIGDLTLRLQPASRASDPSDVSFVSSALGGVSTPVTLLSPSSPLWPKHGANRVLQAADVTPTLLAPGQLDNVRHPLRGNLSVVRSWEEAADEPGGLVMRITLSVPLNATGGGVAIQGLGFSLVSDNTFGGLDTSQVASMLSFMDPHVGRDHSWHTHTRADGSASLLITPYVDAETGSGSSSGCPMEAYRPILEDAAWTQAGTYEWSVHTGAWAKEWAKNTQAPLKSFQGDSKVWPDPKSVWPSWYRTETVNVPDPSSSRQWHAPTSLILAPGQSKTYALRFTLTGSGPASRDAALLAAGRVVFHGVPGYVLSREMTGARLVLELPTGLSLSSVNSSAPHLLSTFTPRRPNASDPSVLSIPLIIPGSTSSSRRARLTLVFSDGSEGTVHYLITPAPSLRDHVSRYGSFMSTTAWLPANDTSDPFGRGASPVAWDREDKVHVMEDARPFAVGLSDDAGGGNALGLAAANMYAPNSYQLARIDEYIHSTLLGKKDPSAHPNLANRTFSLQDPVSLRIRMTVFYFFYTPDYTTALQHDFRGAPQYYKELGKCTIAPSWCAFNAVSNETKPDWHPADYRQYNFPHQIASYYSLYLAARELDRLPSTTLAQPYSWYLEMAAKTLLSLGCCSVEPSTAKKQCVCYPTVGLMDGTVFREVLIALKEEATAAADAAAEEAVRDPSTSSPDWSGYGSLVEYMMRLRVFGGEGAGSNVPWVDQNAPYGSEFNWDTTGQEEVGVWGAFYNASNASLGELSLRAVNSILAYMPSTPNFGYHGSAAGWGDFSNNGKWMIEGGWEREGGHYRAGLNSIPVIERYRSHPDEYYLLEVAMGGITGVLGNIDATGAPSMAFHLYPFILAYDPRSGDHGLGFFGHALNVGAYVVRHPRLGTLCYLCDIVESAAGPAAVEVDEAYTVTLHDSFRRRVYLAEIGLWLVLRTGQQIESVAVSSASLIEGQLVLTLVPTPEGWLSSKIRIQLDTPALATGRRTASGFAVRGGKLVRGAWELPMPTSEGAPTSVPVTITWKEAGERPDIVESG